MKLKIIDHSRHRNGVAGAPFEVVLFQVQREPGCKVGILFDDPGYCAILDVALLAAGDIAFGSASWRGDVFEESLRKAIRISSAGTVRKPAATGPAITVVSIRGGLVEEVRANQPLHVLVEDWDATEVRPAHDPIVPERMLPGEEAELTHFFQPATDQGE